MTQLPDDRPPSARLIQPAGMEVLTIFGPVVQVLTPIAGPDEGPLVMRGTIPAGMVIPLHSHPDVETVFHLSGPLEGLSENAYGFHWHDISPGDVFHVPAGARHAFRNRGVLPAVSLLVSTNRMGRFFEAVGDPIHPEETRPPSPEKHRHFLSVAARFGHWSGTPEDNARVGISLG